MLFLHVESKFGNETLNFENFEKGWKIPVCRLHPIIALIRLQVSSLKGELHPQTKLSMFFKRYLKISNTVSKSVW